MYEMHPLREEEVDEMLENSCSLDARAGDPYDVELGEGEGLLEEGAYSRSEPLSSQDEVARDDREQEILGRQLR